MSAPVATLEWRLAEQDERNQEVIAATWNYLDGLGYRELDDILAQLTDVPPLDWSALDEWAEEPGRYERL